MPTTSWDDETVTVAENDTRVRKPPLYKVLLHNDDYTTMDFVLTVLESIFNRTPADAFRLMLEVHTKGVGVAGIYPFEIAEMKAGRVTDLARANDFPLLCTVEEE